MGLQFKTSGVLLFTAGNNLAMHPDCCCGSATCAHCTVGFNGFDITATGWTPTVDPAGCDEAGDCVDDLPVTDLSIASSYGSGCCGGDTFVTATSECNGSTGYLIRTIDWALQKDSVTNDIWFRVELHIDPGAQGEPLSAYYGENLGATPGFCSLLSGTATLDSYSANETQTCIVAATTGAIVCTPPSTVTYAAY